MLGVVGALGGGDGVGPVLWVFVGEAERRPGLSEVPDDVGGEHADEHVGSDTGFEVVVDRAQVEVDCFDRPEVRFDCGEVFVGLDNTGGVEAVGVEAGSDHVDPVKGGFGVDLVGEPLVGERSFGDDEFVVFGHLVTVRFAANVARFWRGPRSVRR